MWGGAQKRNDAKTHLGSVLCLAGRVELVRAEAHYLHL